MPQFTRILCPIDFSDGSRHALDYAVSLARHYASTLTLLHVRPLGPAIPFTPALPLSPVSSTTEDVDDGLVALKRLADANAGRGLTMDVEIRDGNPASQILAVAAGMASDLIVMGTHGRSGFERLVLGSVTEKVIHKALCPVLTVPPPFARAVPADAVRFTRILCGVDFSDASLTALEYALSLAQTTGAELHLVHVVEVSPAPRPDVQGDAETRALGDYVAAAAEARAKQLQQLVPDGISRHCRIETMLAIGSAHREILRLATERDADIIVLGAHGFGVSQLLFGSAAHQIVRQAGCPVLTIR